MPAISEVGGFFSASVVNNSARVCATLHIHVILNVSHLPTAINFSEESRILGPLKKDLGFIFIAFSKSVTLVAAKCEITELDKCEGEAVANNRKGKLIFFYEWDIVLKWTGKLEGGEKEAEGTITIPNLSEENDVSEVDVSVSVKNSSPEADKLKEFLMKEGKEVIREQLNHYIVALKEEFSKGMILPKKDDVSNSKNDSVANLSAGFNKQIRMNHSDKNEMRACKINTTTLKFLEKFQCTGEEFYNAMTVIEVSSRSNGSIKRKLIFAKCSLTH
ncbi:hypothetical protein C0J52_27998 [Blattella germanica]|nr:hypothetical protein C0J52_27998 [Blattella germanica]